MKDNGSVISIKKDLAQVEIHCFNACESCSVHSLCIGNKASTRLLSVKNSLSACPGDEVEIEIPDSTYNSALIKIFGFLLFAMLFGMGVGYLCSPILPLAPSASSLSGLIGGLIFISLWLFRQFRGKENSRLYPVIIDITKKGAYHE
ncbi:SoxR reducing system RseC family protein [Acidobacteriota bacterium]